jgi:hypothetical protein
MEKFDTNGTICIYCENNLYSCNSVYVNPNQNGQEQKEPQKLKTLITKKKSEVSKKYIFQLLAFRYV